MGNNKPFESAEHTKQLLESVTEKDKHQIQSVEVKKGNTYFSEHWKDFLEEARLTRRELADIMGINPSNLPKVFNSKNALVLDRVARILKVPVAVLINGIDTKLYKDYKVYGVIRANGRTFMIDSVSDLEKVIETLRMYQD